MILPERRSTSAHVLGKCSHHAIGARSESNDGVASVNKTENQADGYEIGLWVFWDE